MKTDFLNSSGLGAAWAILITIAVAPLGTGCVFMDDDDSRVRGYTECGSFMGGESCSPGQYCSDPQFSQCDLGCLSDVNCASNQTCVKGGNQVGVCENVAVVRHGLTADGADSDAGMTWSTDVSGGDTLSR